MRKVGQNGTGKDAVLAAMQSELALLRDENAQLRLERQQNVTPASSAARLATLVDAMAQTTEPGEVEWATLSEALMLRECLASVCDELERTVGAVRRQMQTATPTPELERRQGDRRRATNDAPTELDLLRDAKGTPPVDLLWDAQVTPTSDLDLLRDGQGTPATGT
jgi:hypothetical protein